MSQELKEYIEQTVKLGDITQLNSWQLLSLIFEKGNKTQSQFDLAKEVVTMCGDDLSHLVNQDFNTILKRTSLSGKYGLKLAALMELSKRVKKSPEQKVDYIYTSADSYNLLKPIYNNINREEFWVTYLNNSLRVLETIKVGEGGLDTTPVDIKLIIKGAIKTLASKIILSHNHLTPNPTPSTTDDALTVQITNAAALFDIKVIDHIIVGEKGYYSYND